MFTKLTTITKATKSSLRRVLCDRCVFVIFVRKPWAVGVVAIQLVVAISLLALSACASAQAKSKPEDRPALKVPPPPSRVIEPAPVPEPVPEPVVEPPPATPPNRATRPPASKPEAKPGEPKPVEPPPVEPPPAPAPAATPPAQLQTPQTSDTSGAAKTVRTTIDTARGILNGVNFGPLSNERKKAYNDVKLFLRQAEDALRQGNLAFAQGVASKAETLAKELAGR